VQQFATTRLEQGHILPLGAALAEANRPQVLILQRQRLEVLRTRLGALVHALQLARILRGGATSHLGARAEA